MKAELCHEASWMLWHHFSVEARKSRVLSPVCRMNKCNKTETDSRYREQTSDSRGEVGGWTGELGEAGTERYKLPAVK